MPSLSRRKSLPIRDIKQKWAQTYHRTNRRSSLSVNVLHWRSKLFLSGKKTKLPLQAVIWHGGPTISTYYMSQVKLGLHSPPWRKLPQSYSLIPPTYIKNQDFSSTLNTPHLTSDTTLYHTAHVELLFDFETYTFWFCGPASIFSTIRIIWEVLRESPELPLHRFAKLVFYYLTLTNILRTTITRYTGGECCPRQQEMDVHAAMYLVFARPVLRWITFPWAQEKVLIVAFASLRPRSPADNASSQSIHRRSVLPFKSWPNLFCDLLLRPLCLGTSQIGLHPFELPFLVLHMATTRNPVIITA